MKKPIHCCGVLCFHSRTKKRLFYFNGRKAKIRPGLSHIVTLNHTVSVFFHPSRHYYNGGGVGRPTGLSSQ